MITITEIVTLTFTVYYGAKERILGQFLTNKQTERILQVLGPMTQDIKHAVIDNRRYPHWPFAHTLPVKKTTSFKCMADNEMEVSSQCPTVDLQAGLQITLQSKC